MFFIRVDANQTIGTGHVMRCLSIAEEICKRGETVTFLIADHYSEDIIVSKGFTFICLNSVWNDLEMETDWIIEVVSGYCNATLLLDTYYVTEKYLVALKKRIRIVYIDDIDKFIYPVDVLINYNIYAEELCYEERYREKGLDTQFVLGCDFAPLRSEFMNIQHDINDVAERILILSGGTDNFNVVGELLDHLQKNSWFANKIFYVVLGRFNVNIDELKAKWDKVPNVKFLCNVNNMSDYMKNCDIAITAGGVTTYELCACGIPSIMYTLADNQLQIAKTVHEKDICLYVGDVRVNMRSTIQKIETNLEMILEKKDIRKKISRSMQKVVDGKGCKRLVDRLL